MPSPVRYYSNKFNRGEIDNLAIARDDITKVNNSGSLMTNFIPTRLGPMQYRPGTQYLDAIADPDTVYFVPFVGSTTDTAILEFTNNLLRVWVADVLLTATTRATTIVNGEFTTDLTSWIDADETGASSAWSSGKLCLIGTGAKSAIRWQTTTAFAAGEHRLRIVIKESPVFLEIGEGGAVHNSDIFSGLLSVGIHSLVFTPTQDFDITLSNSNKYRACVESVNLETTGTFTLPTNISQASLSSIRFSQSADVMFIAWNGGIQLRIERRSTGSWSIVDFQSNDGPFGLINSTETTLTPAALSGGNVNLVASRSYFKSTDVDAIFKLVSQGQEVTASLTAQDTGTNSIRVTDVDSARIFIITVTGITDSTITLQRSTDDATWVDVEAYTTVQSKNFDDGFDNSILFYRLHIKTGDYGTDTVVASLQYEGGSIEGLCRVISFTSVTVVVVNIFQDFGRTDATRDWYRGEWDGTLGFPTAVALYEGRLWMAGKTKAWGSVSDVFNSFDTTLVGNSAAISKTIGFGPVDCVEWLLAINRLLMGIASDELSIRSNSFGDVLVPSNANIKPGSTQGAAGISPVAINSRGYFVQRSLKKIYELDYSVDQDIHDSLDLMVLNPDICNAGIKRIAFTMQPEIRIYVVLDDGEARVYLMDKSEDVAAWSRITTDGTFTDVVVLPGVTEDRVYFSVLRSGGHYLEKLALFSDAKGGTTSKHTDSFVAYTSPGATLTGLDHLEGKTVRIWADGQERETTLVVSGGSVTLSSGSYTSVVAGLLHTADYQSSKLGNFATHSVLTYDKRIINTGFVLKDYWPKSITVGPDTSNLDVFPDIEDGKAVVLTATQSQYDQKPFPFDGTSETDPRISIRAIAPCTILAMSYGIDESEDPTEADMLRDKQLDFYGRPTAEATPN